MIACLEEISGARVLAESGSLILEVAPSTPASAERVLNKALALADLHQVAIITELPTEVFWMAKWALKAGFGHTGAFDAKGEILRRAPRSP